MQLKQPDTTSQRATGSSSYDTELIERRVTKGPVAGQRPYHISGAGSGPGPSPSACHAAKIGQTVQTKTHKAIPGRTANFH